MARPRNKDLDLGRLCAAMAKARLQLRYARQSRFDMVRQAIGAHWSEDAADRSVPVNVMSMYQNIVSRKLVPHNPQVMVQSFNRQDRAVMIALEQWANRRIKDIRLGKTLKRWVVDALYSMGVLKVAIADPAAAATVGWNLHAGDVMVQRIDFDDWVYDVHARDYDECGYMGHRFRVPLEVVRESKIYGKRRKELEADEDRLYNLEGDERIHVLGRGYYTNQEEYEDFIDLWEIYLPRHRVVVTIADQDLQGGGGDDGKWYRRALREQRWIGPDCGPYHILGYQTIPGNAMPKGPIQDVYDLHLAINNIARKLIQQCRDMKRVTMVAGGADADGNRVLKANDGDMIRCDNPSNIIQMVLGGPQQELGLMLQQFWQLTNLIAGNLELMGGLGPQSKTATQDELLNQNNSAAIGDLQEETISKINDVVKAMMWFWHHHPTGIMRQPHGIPGSNISVVKEIYPNNPAIHGNVPGRLVRRQKFEDMLIEVDAYSLQHSTPQMKSAQLLQSIQQVYAPLAQLAAQQGIQIDLHALFEKLGKYWNMPDLQDVLTIQEPPQQPGTSGSDAGVGMPQNTERTYTRRSLGGDGQQAKEALMANVMSNGAFKNGTSNGQQSEGPS